MPDFHTMMKEIAAAERRASYPMEFCYGTVVAQGPFLVQVDQKNILGKAFFVVFDGVTAQTFAVGDKLILLRQQGGQQYLILGKKGAL